MMVRACNLSTLKADTGEMHQFEARLGYGVRLAATKEFYSMQLLNQDKLKSRHS